MIRIVIALAVSLLVAGCQEDGPSFSTQTTEGGMDYTLIQSPGSDYISIQVAWPTDWAGRADVNQAAPRTAIDLMLAGGATGFPPGEVVELFADLDAEAYLDVTVDHVLGQLTFPPEHLYQALEVANAHLASPTFDESWFARVRDGFEQNVVESRAQDQFLAFEAVRWAVFGEQPIRNALSMDEPGLFENLKLEDVRQWHAEFITNAPQTVVVVGDTDAETAGTAVDLLFASLPDPGDIAPAPFAADFTPLRILLHRPDAQATTLGFVGQVPPTRMGQEFEDLMLLDALGQGDQSVLFNAVRTELRASYGFSVGFANYSREDRIFYMTGEVEGSKLADAERVIREAYDAFRADGPSGSVADRKVPYNEYFSDIWEYAVDQGQMEIQSVLDGYPAGRSLDILGEVESVSADTLAERLTTAFPPASDLIMVAVSPDADALPGACVITAPQEAMDC